MTIEVQGPPTRKVPWRWILLVGCALLLLVASTCAGMLVLGYGVFRQTVILDRPRVAALAQEIIPGAAPPPGYVAAVGSDIAGFKMAIFMPENPPAGHSTMGVFQLPVKPEDLDPNQALEELNRNQEQSSGTVLESGAGTMTLGGRQVPCLRQVVAESQSRQIRRIAFLASTAGKVVMVLMEGPEGREDQHAFATFGQGLRLDGYRSLDAGVSGGAAGSGPAEAEPQPPAGSPRP